MMWLVLVFLVSLLAMVFIPLRHLSEVRVRGESVAGNSQSLARSQAIKALDHVAGWYNSHAKTTALKAVDRSLNVLEKTAGKFAGSTKRLRFLVQEQFRVIPRESLYWREMRIWKKSNGNGTSRAIRENGNTNEEDTSNHKV